MRWFKAHTEAPRLLSLSPLQAEEDLDGATHHLHPATRFRDLSPVRWTRRKSSSSESERNCYNVQTSQVTTERTSTKKDKKKIQEERRRICEKRNPLLDKVKTTRLSFLRDQDSDEEENPEETPKKEFRSMGELSRRALTRNDIRRSVCETDLKELTEEEKTQAKRKKRSKSHSRLTSKNQSPERFVLFNFRTSTPYKDEASFPESPKSSRGWRKPKPEEKAKNDNQQNDNEFILKNENHLGEVDSRESIREGAQFDSLTPSSCLAAKFRAMQDRYLKSSTSKLIAKIYKKDSKDRERRRLRSFSYGTLPGLEELRTNPLYEDQDQDDNDSGILDNDSATSSLLDDRCSSGASELLTSLLNESSSSSSPPPPPRLPPRRPSVPITDREKNLRLCQHEPNPVIIKTEGSCKKPFAHNVCLGIEKDPLNVICQATNKELIQKQIQSFEICTLDQKPIQSNQPFEIRTPDANQKQRSFKTKPERLQSSLDLNSKNGSSKMENGSSSMENGSSNMANGSSNMANGSSNMTNGSSNITNGSSNMTNGSSNITNGSSNMKYGSLNMENDSSNMENSSSSMKNSSSNMKNGSSNIENSLRCNLENLSSNIENVSRSNIENTSRSNIQNTSRSSIQNELKPPSLKPNSKTPRSPRKELPVIRSRSCTTETMVVKLPRETADQCLGIFIAKTSDSNPGYLVAHVVPNGLADKEGSLKIGDEILIVNGKRLRGLTMGEARKILGNGSGPGMVDIVISRYSNLEQPRKLKESSVDYENVSIENGHGVIVENSPKCHFRKHNSRHHRDRKNESNRSISSEKSCATHDSGSQSVSNFCTLPRRPRSTLSTFLTVVFEKGPGKKSLGFTIVGGRDSPKGSIGIFIKSVLPGGQAAEDGRLRAGDEILAVNGQVCHDLTHREAVQLFRNNKSGPVALHLCRRSKQRDLQGSKAKSCADLLLVDT